MDKHVDYVCILDSINIDKEDTFDADVVDSNHNTHVRNDEYRNIDMDYDFTKMIW